MFALKFLPTWILSLTVFCKFAKCEEWTPQQILIEAASQREAIVSYDCDISMTIKSENEKDVILKGRVEVSKIDDSYCCTMYDPVSGEPTSFFGQCGNYGFSGSRDNAASYFHPRKGKKSTDYFQKVLPDPLASGFGFCSDIKRAVQIDDLLRWYKPLIDNFNFEVITKDNSKILLTDHGRIFGDRKSEITWDSKRGFWPIKSEHKHSDWNITLVEIGDYWMPEACSINCMDNSTIKHVEIDYRWHSVNEVLTTGKQRFQELIVQLDCK